MLKRKYRLPASSKLTHPSTYNSTSWRLMITKNKFNYSRFGFVISKKIDKRAVVRNRTKRLVRSCVEEIRHKIIDGCDMLFILHQKAVGQKREILFSEIELLFKNTQLLK